MEKHANSLEIAAVVFAVVMTFILAVILGQTRHDLDVAHAELQNQQSFVTTNAESVFWQINDNAPMTLVLPVYPDMTWIDELGFMNVRSVEGQKPVFWRQFACYGTGESPYDPDTSYLICNVPPGIQNGQDNILSITMVDVETLFKHGGYAVGAVK